jgi:hypothetical protein
LYLPHCAFYKKLIRYKYNDVGVPLEPWRAL